MKMRQLSIIFLIMIVSIASAQKEPLFDKGVEALNKKQYKEAENYFTKSIKRLPKNAMAYYNRGFARLYLNRYEDALGDFDKTLELDSNYADAYNNRGLIYGMMGKPEEALFNFDKAIEKDRNYSEAYLNRGSLFLDGDSLESIFPARSGLL